MTTGLLLGCALGAALCLLLYSLVPPQPSLGATIARWERQREQHNRAALTNRDDSARGEGVATWSALVGGRVVAGLAHRGITLAKLRVDLELTDYTLESHVVRKLSYGLLGLLLPSVTALVMVSSGVSLPLSIPAISGFALAGLFFWVPDLSVAQEAAQRRHELRRALSCYLDLVAMSLAGGRGIPEALPTAARIGRGWAFELLQDTIDRARRVGDTPWAALAALGKRTGMQELQDLGGALMLVADDGAKVRSSLTARASTQRRRQLAEAEGAAARADQSIQMAQVVLAAGFFLFLGYPAVVAVMGI
jgi:tight adherence protein C